MTQSTPPPIDASTTIPVVQDPIEDVDDTEITPAAPTRPAPPSPSNSFLDLTDKDETLKTPPIRLSQEELEREVSEASAAFALDLRSTTVSPMPPVPPPRPASHPSVKARIAKSRADAQVRLRATRVRQAEEANRRRAPNAANRNPTFCSVCLRMFGYPLTTSPSFCQQCKRVFKCNECNRPM